MQRKQYVVEGPKIVKEAIPYCAAEMQIYASPDWIEAEDNLLREFNPDIQTVTGKELSRISQLKTANEVVAVLPISNPSLPEKLSGINLLLENIQDPGNLGTIIRCADWFGVNAIFCTPDSVERYNPKVIQAGMGSHFHLPVYSIALDELLKQFSLPIYGAALDGENLYTVDKLQDLIIAIGNESKGLSKVLKAKCHKNIAIPRRGKAESLNAAMATGIILSHF